jgi:long-chain acyl-CoA synthetase
MSENSLDRVFNIPYYQLGNQKHNNHIGIWDKGEYFSIQQFCEKIDLLSLFLIEIGTHKGDLIGIAFDSSSPWWNIIDFAIQKVGAISIALHAFYSDKELNLITRQIDLFACFTTNSDFSEKLKQKRNETIVLAEDSSEGFNSLIVKKENISKYQKKLEERLKESTIEDIATILFTSGTSGVPKGVMLSHKNILSNINSISSIIPIYSKHVVVSFLPLEHIFERVAVYFYLYKGVSIHYIIDRNKLLEGVSEIRPHFFSSVPRVLENALSQIRSEYREKSVVSKTMVDQAFYLGSKLGIKKWYHIGYWLQLMILDFFVFKQWRKALGGNIIGIIVGGSAMARRLGNILAAAKIKVREGYGLSETSPSLTFNRFGKGGNKFGTAGKPIPGVELKIDSNEEGVGEIFVRGPNIMKGYYRDSELTTKSFTKDGFFKTGDLGYLDEEGFLVISGRKSQIYKTSSGKFVNAYNLEAVLKSVEEVDQCLIVGFQKPFVSALIVPKIEILKTWAFANKVHWTTSQYMVHNIAIRDFVQRKIDTINLQLKSHERVRKFILISEPWTVENGILTATAKIRRTEVLNKYHKEIDKLYREQ